MIGRLAVLGWSGMAGLAVMTLGAGPVPQPDRLNVLFIVADDLNNDLGLYGAPVSSPNIDALASGGVRFDRAYTQFPLCNPSRASLLTGRRPNATGVLANPAPARPMSPHLRERLPQAVTLPQLFKNNGWFAARVGKLYHYGVPNNIGTSSLDDFPSWDLVVNPRGHDREIHDRIVTIGQPGNFGGTLSWFADDRPDEEQTDGIAALEAVRLLERFAREKRPFFLGVGFYRPHTPYVAPSRYFDMYPPDRVPLPELSDDDRARTPAPAYASAQAVQDAMDDGTRRQAIAAYRASTTMMDAQVGILLRALDRLGLAERTVVVFTSDHGYHLGDHGLWQKSSLFERSARVPLVIAAPNARGKGGSAAGVVELVDLYRTLADLAGLSPAPEIEGTSLRPMLDDPSASVKAHAFTQIRNGYSVRTVRYRYTEWAGGERGVQLHDLDRDPGETRNLAGDPAHAAVRSELSRVLADYRGDQPATDTAPVQRVLDDYIGLYAKDRLPEWKALFLPGFVASYTNDDGSVTTRTLEEFYERQRTAFERGPVSETLHDVRITRTGRLAEVAAGFDFTSSGTTRRGRLRLQLVEAQGQFKIAALTFTYHLQ